MPAKTVKFLVDFAFPSYVLLLTFHALPLPNANRKFLPGFHVSRLAAPEHQSEGGFTFHANVILKSHYFRAVSALFLKEVFTTL
jgi:hypothetical protein